jgi:hypothetical protein
MRCTQLKKLVLLVIVGLFATTCAASGECPITGGAIKSEDEALILAQKAIVAFKLTTIPIVECLHFDTDKSYKGSGYSFDVRENHTEKCGGAPETAPRLFTIVIKANGTITTDNFSSDHLTQRPLRCKSKHKR